MKGARNEVPAVAAPVSTDDLREIEDDRKLAEVCCRRKTLGRSCIWRSLRSAGVRPNGPAAKVARALATLDRRWLCDACHAEADRVARLQERQADARSGASVARPGEEGGAS